MRYPLSFSPRDLPKGLLVEINFSKIVPNLKIAFSIALNLVLKVASCHLATIDITGTGFVLTIPYAEEQLS